MITSVDYQPMRWVNEDGTDCFVGKRELAYRASLFVRRTGYPATWLAYIMVDRKGSYFAELPSGKLISASSEDRAKQAAFRAARMFDKEN